MSERLEEIVKQVKRSDEYAEKGLWEASDGMIVHLHNEGHINYLVKRVQELEDHLRMANQYVKKEREINTNIKQQNKELFESLATIGNAIHEGEISGRGTDENFILEVVDKHWRNHNE